MQLMFWDDRYNVNFKGFNCHYEIWKLSIPLEVPNFLSNWLNHNIVKTDKNDDYFFDGLGLN
jgi:hypothetical protein